MSNALGISAVSAVLQYLLTTIYNGSGLTVSVTAVAPDMVPIPPHSLSSYQVNVFLHQVTFNAAWRNVDLPSLSPDGSTRLSNAPLALDLHYLLTAYGSADCEAEALLGFAVQFMHETPVLARNDIRTALTHLPASNPLSAMLGASGLAEQIEMIRITPATLGREELAWLWTALKADYRPTFPFQVTVVLIQKAHPLRSGPPVLTRLIQALPSPMPPVPVIPILTEADPPQGQPAACLGDTVTLAGANLAGATGVVLSNSRLGVDQPFPPLSNPGDTSFQFTMSVASNLPVGTYVLSAQVTMPGTGVQSTNGVPLAIAPKIDSSPTTLASGSTVNVTIQCTPELRPGQLVSLLIGGQEAPADPFTTPTKAPSFTFPTLKPTSDKVPVWLRVDGIDSPTIDFSQSPPAYSAPLVEVT